MNLPETDSLAAKVRLAEEFLDPLLHVEGFIGKTPVGVATGVYFAAERSMLLSDLQVYDFSQKPWTLRRFFDLGSRRRLRGFGIGSRLLDRFLEMAKQLGVIAVHGSVTHGDLLKTPRLIEFYANRGFRRLPAGPDELLGAICRVEWNLGSALSQPLPAAAAAAV
ncbi:MAG: GNAT family N-acetyltransferase [Verrucomicrobia bacterium]|nr:GNAT family N-acetyltransferase [Verrucomicrobiota bacterium]